MSIDMGALTCACLLGVLFGIVWYVIWGAIKTLPFLFLGETFLTITRFARLMKGIAVSLELMLFSIGVILFQYVAYAGAGRGIIILSILSGYGLFAATIGRHLVSLITKMAICLHKQIARIICFILNPFLRFGRYLLGRIAFIWGKVCLHIERKRAKMIVVKYTRSIYARARAKTLQELQALERKMQRKYERDPQDFSITG